MDLDKWTSKLSEVRSKLGSSKIETHKGVEMAATQLGMSSAELDARISQGISWGLIWVSIIAPFLAGGAAEMIKKGRSGGAQAVSRERQTTTKQESSSQATADNVYVLDNLSHSVKVWLGEATEVQWGESMPGGESRRQFERWLRKSESGAVVSHADFKSALISIYGRGRVKDATCGFTVSGVILKGQNKRNAVASV
jgi:hypothetical protein